MLLVVFHSTQQHHLDKGDSEATPTPTWPELQNLFSVGRHGIPRVDLECRWVKGMVVLRTEPRAPAQKYYRSLVLGEI